MSSREPQRYEVTVVRGPEGGATLDAGARPTIVGGAPPEFGGSAAVWSPEHLLVSAAALCFVTTFEWFARRKQLDIVELRCHGEGAVDKTAVGLAFTGVRLAVRLVVPAGRATAARELLESAKAACLVANSLRCPVELGAEVVEAA